MSKIQRNLCCLLLNELYGEVVQQVADYILRSGSKPLFVIRTETKLPLLKVKQALSVLIHQNYASPQINEKNRYIEYVVHVDRVLNIVKYPRYIFCIKQLYGDIAELIVEEILENGQLTIEKIIKNVLERSNEHSDGEQTPVKPSDIQDKFANLVNAHFIQRCPALILDENHDKSMPVFSTEEKSLYDIPKIDIDSLKEHTQGDSEPNNKKLKLEHEADQKIYWKINYERFIKYFRDELICKGISKKLGWKSSQVYQAILKVAESKSTSWSVNTVPSSKQELNHYLMKNNCSLNTKELDQYLAVLVDDETTGLSKVGDSSGGLYSVNYRKVVDNLLLTMMHSIVQERFGSKSARIFRLIALKRFLEQKQIEELAMIPAKDAKELTYKMFQENFLEAQELPKTPDYAPSRTFYFFHVNLQKLTRMLLEQSYKAIHNLILYREMVMKENKRLIEKKQRVDAILATLKQSGGDEAQLREVKESITPPEEMILTKTNRIADKLESAELHLDENIFILNLALRYECSAD